MDSIPLTSILFSMRVGEGRENEGVGLPFLTASTTRGKEARNLTTKGPFLRSEILYPIKGLENEEGASEAEVTEAAPGHSL